MLPKSLMSPPPPPLYCLHSHKTMKKTIKVQNQVQNSQLLCFSGLCLLPPEELPPYKP